MQNDLKKYGFLLLVKASDSNKFKQTENFNNYRPIVDKYKDMFGTFKGIEED